jgi:hypothetical protein
MAKHKSKKIIQVPIDDELLNVSILRRVFSPRAAQPLSESHVNSA